VSKVVGLPRLCGCCRFAVIVGGLAHDEVYCTKRRTVVCTDDVCHRYKRPKCEAGSLVFYNVERRESVYE